MAPILDNNYQQCISTSTQFLFNRPSYLDSSLGLEHTQWYTPPFYGNYTGKPVLASTNSQELEDFLGATFTTHMHLLMATGIPGFRRRCSSMVLSSVYCKNENPCTKLKCGHLRAICPSCHQSQWESKLLLQNGKKVIRWTLILSSSTCWLSNTPVFSWNIFFGWLIITKILLLNTTNIFTLTTVFLFLVLSNCSFYYLPVLWVAVYVLKNSYQPRWL